MDPKLGATKAIVAITAIGGPLGNAMQRESELFKRDRPSEEGRLSLVRQAWRVVREHHLMSCGYSSMTWR